MKSWGIWLVLAAIVAIQVWLLVGVINNAKVTNALAKKSGVPASTDRTKVNSKGAPVAHVHSEWKSGTPPIPIVIDLDQNDDETVEEFAARATQFINDMKAAFPPNP